MKQLNLRFHLKKYVLIYKIHPVVLFLYYVLKYTVTSTLPNNKQVVINVFNISILQEFTSQKYVKKYKIHNSGNSHAFLLTNYMDGDEINNTEVLLDLMFLGTTYLVRFRAEFNLL